MCFKVVRLAHNLNPSVVLFKIVQIIYFHTIINNYHKFKMETVKNRTTEQASELIDKKHDKTSQKDRNSRVSSDKQAHEIN